MHLVPLVKPRLQTTNVALLWRTVCVVLYTICSNCCYNTVRESYSMPHLQGYSTAVQELLSACVMIGVLHGNKCSS